MSDKSIAVYGIYPNRPVVENAVYTLKSRGFRNPDISVLFSDSDGSKEFAHEKGTKAPEGAAAGLGGTLGGVAGGLIGMGIPEYEAKRYEGIIKNGGILLSVHCDNATWTKKAKVLLEETGAHDTASSGEARAAIKMDPHNQRVGGSNQIF